MRVFAARWVSRSVAEHVARDEDGEAVLLDDGWAVRVDRPHPWEGKGGHGTSDGLPVSDV